jgi:glycosyltransferase involved in cell wall biosynthesis
MTAIGQASAQPVDRVVVINDDSVASGGAAGIALLSAHGFAARGFPVTFLTGDHGDNPALRAAGVEIVGYDGSHIMEGGRARAALRGLYDPGARAFVQGWIDRNDTPGTVYHLHNWHKFLSPAVFPSLKAVAHRLALSIHDYFLVCPNGGYFDFQKHRPCDLKPLSAVCLTTACDKRHMGHKLWRSARTGVRQALIDFRNTQATILAVHDGMIPHLTRGGIPESAIRVLRNPVTPWRAARVAAEKNRTVFFVGRLELDKGVDVLARAAKAAGAPLCVIGDGPLRQSLAAAHPEAQFVGWKSRADIVEMVADCRFFVLPSRWRETFGLVALEAATSGLPVVMSRFAPVSSELERLGAGIACDPFDEQGLATIIRRLACDDAAVATMSHAAFASAAALAHSGEAWLDDLLQLYGVMLTQATSSTRLTMRPAPPFKAAQAIATDMR